jgi:CRISPR-associated protein Csm5
MTTFKVSLKTRTPLHIGDGDELRQDFDFGVLSDRTYRLNDDAILQAKEAQVQSGARGEYPLLTKLLQEADYQNPAYFRYSLAGAPHSARVKSQIKDVHDRPYIPGSSLKGALRTALAWTGWDEVKPKLDRGAIGRSAQPLEKKLFGPDPTHDLLRALHVSDLRGAGKAGEGLMLINAQVLTTKNAKAPIEDLEAIRCEVTFKGSLTIDEVLFTSFTERELHFANRKHWLDELLIRVQRHSLARIEHLAEWFERAEGCEGIANFYRQLAGDRVASNAALVQIGWGAGWDGKTLWTHLQTDPVLFEQLVTDFGMHKASKDSPPRKVGDPFPRSKRAAIGKTNKPVAPLGWVLMELTPVGEPTPEWQAMIRTRESAPRIEITQPVVAPQAEPVKPTTASSLPPPRPTTPPPITESKPKPAPESRPLIAMFTERPKVGDQFKGKVTYVDGRELELSIPGLESSVAYAHIAEEDNNSSKRFKVGDTVMCEVIGLKQETNGRWQVQCQRG